MEALEAAFLAALEPLPGYRSPDAVSSTPGVPLPGPVPMMRSTSPAPAAGMRRRLETPMASARNGRATVSHVQPATSQYGVSATRTPNSLARPLQSSSYTPAASVASSYTPATEPSSQAASSSAARPRRAEPPRSSASKPYVRQLDVGVESAIASNKAKGNSVVVRRLAEDAPRVQSSAGSVGHKDLQRSPRPSPSMEPRRVAPSKVVHDNISETSGNTSDQLRPHMQTEKLSSVLAPASIPPVVAAQEVSRPQRQNTPISLSTAVTNGLSTRTEQKLANLETRTVSSSTAIASHAVSSGSTKSETARVAQSPSLSTNAGSFSVAAQVTPHKLLSPDSAITPSSVSIGAKAPLPAARYIAGDASAKPASITAGTRPAGMMSVPHPALAPAEKAARVVPTSLEIVSTSSKISAMAPAMMEIVSTSSVAMSLRPLDSPSVRTARLVDGSISSPAKSSLGDKTVPSAYPRTSSHLSPRLHASRTPFNRSLTGEVQVQRMISQGRRSSDALHAVAQTVGGGSIRTLANDQRGEPDGRRKVLAARSLSPHRLAENRSPFNASREGRPVILQRDVQTTARDRSTRREVSTLVPGSAVQAPGGARIGQNRATKLSIIDLQVGDGKPDPTQPKLRSHLIAELGLSQRAIITPMKGGGQNEGIWTFEDGTKSYVMKLVKHQLPHQSLTTDVDRLARLASECPVIVDDPALTFPVKMFRCKDPTGSHSHDLLVMRKASGRALTEYIALKWAEGKGAPLVMDLLEKVGGFLADFHKKYGHKQHCDFHPTNLFYDEATGLLTMIDVGSIGASTCTTDMDHFIQGLAIMSRMLGPKFHTDGQSHFRAGYAMSAR